jgi:RNA-directed DNA polymerase
MSLRTPEKVVEKLQRTLHAKAKAEPGYRFYSLWDKVCQKEVLQVAYGQCRSNRGAAGVDRESFADIEAQGVDRWLGNLQRELKAKTYRPKPLLRVWIPKSNGGQRPLGIPAIFDRVVQTAMLLALGPIFEADFPPQQYGFRPNLDAKIAVRRVYFHLREGKTDVVDGDVRDYFNQIPHGPLLKSLCRRIVDGTVLSTLKAWLDNAVVERTSGREQRSTATRDTHRGSPQGSPISPLLSNVYFRRFALGFLRSEVAHQAEARLVNYADDLVICCRPGTGPMVMDKTREIMGRLGLELHEQKSRVVSVPAQRFDFLGYTFGQFYGRHGKPYIGTAPSKKSVSRVIGKIADETSTRWITDPASKRIDELNPILRGWCGYFDQGPVQPSHMIVKQYTERRVRRWLMKKHKRRGTGYRQYPDEYLYNKLGLYKPPATEIGPSKAKA